MLSLVRELRNSLVREQTRYSGAWALVCGAGLAMALDRNALALVLCITALATRKIEEA